MSWLTILWRAVELIAALLQKLRPAPASEPAKPRITKASVDEQIAHQRDVTDIPTLRPAQPPAIRPALAVASSSSSAIWFCACRSPACFS
jgi:hypothetical protein